MTTLEKTMYERAEQQFNQILEMDEGSEDWVKTMNGANSTVDRLNELRKIRLEEKKLELEKQKLEAEKRNRWIDTGTKVALFMVAAGISIWANVDSKKFEGAFTHTTQAGRQSESKLLSFMDRVKV